MKKLLAAAALATVFAAPAFAQTATQAPRAQFNNDQFGGRDGQRHSVNPAYDVYDHGQYVGSDPDPSIRLQLKRDNERDQY